MAKKSSSTTWLVVVLAAAFGWMLFKNKGTNGPKYNVGNVLGMTGSAETFTVIGFQTTSNVLQYVLRSSNYPGTADFALDVAFVDGSTLWHKAG